MGDESLWRRFLGVAVAVFAAAWVAGSVGGALAAAADGGQGHAKRDGGHGGHRDGGVLDGGGSGLERDRDTRTSISLAD